MDNIDRKSFKNLYEFLKEDGEKFTKTASNNRITIKCVWGEYSTGTKSSIPLKELHFIKQIQSYIKNNNIANKVKNTFKGDYKVNYYKFGDIKGKSFKEQYEVDIKAAYWETFYQLEMVNKLLYEKGLTMKKKTRNACIGSQAKKTTEYKFNGKKLSKPTFTRKDKTEHLWFLVAKRIGQVMTKAMKAAGNDFIFFWIDGIYVTNKKAIERVVKVFESEGYVGVVKPIKKIEVTEKSVIVTDFKYKLVNGNKKYERKFPLSVNTKITSLT